MVLQGGRAQKVVSRSGRGNASRGGPKCGNAEAVLQSLDELQPGGTVSHAIPHRPYVAYTFFQGDAKKNFLVMTCYV